MTYHYQQAPTDVYNYEVFLTSLFSKRLYHSWGYIDSRKELGRILRFLAGTAACSTFEVRKVQHGTLPMDIYINGVLVFTYNVETLEYQTWHFEITHQLDPLVLLALKRRYERNRSQRQTSV